MRSLFGNELFWVAASAAATCVLAVCTFWLGLETKRLAREWRDTSKDQIATWEKTSKDQIAAWEKSTKDQIGVQVWMTMEARFDSQEMKQARRKLAFQLDPYDSTKHDDIGEHVLEFFESVGSVYLHGFLTEKLAESSFSYHANRWWEAAKSYVDAERREHKADDTLYCDFEAFVKAMWKYERHGIDKDELKSFLEAERHITE